MTMKVTNKLIIPACIFHIDHCKCFESNYKFKDRVISVTYYLK